MERTPNKSQTHEVNSGEENSPAAPAGIRTRDLSITSLALLPTSNPGPNHVPVYEPAEAAVFLRRTRLNKLKHQTVADAGGDGATY